MEDSLEDLLGIVIPAHHQLIRRLTITRVERYHPQGTSVIEMLVIPKCITQTLDGSAMANLGTAQEPGKEVKVSDGRAREDT